MRHQPASPAQGRVTSEMWRPPGGTLRWPGPPASDYLTVARVKDALPGTGKPHARAGDGYAGVSHP